MRDLERLHDVVEYRVNAGQLKLVFVGVLAAACAIFAVGVSVGKRIEPAQSGLASDPLAELDRAVAGVSGAAGETTSRDEAPALTYHDELTEGAARRAAEPETPPPAPAAPAPSLAVAAAAIAPASPTPTAPAATPAPEEPVASEPARPEEPRPGESSVFTLQVATFETREEARQFAADLRGRGHRSFLIRTSTPERGTWYRVRVGPFHSRREATRYQHRFERTERLPTFLVQRRRG